MNWLTQFGLQLWNLGKTLLQFFIDEVDSLVNLIQHLPEYLSYLTNTIALVPVWLNVFCKVFIAVALILMIPRYIHG